MKIRFRRLHPGAIVPEKATEGSAAYDVYCPFDFTMSHGRHIIPLGLAMEIPYGYEAAIQPRSGYAAKGFEVINEPICDTDGNVKVEGYVTRADIDVEIGCIDSDYRGGIGVIVNSHETRPVTVRRGQRIAQMIFRRVEDVEFEETDELSRTGRAGGFGSTGS